MIPFQPVPMETSVELETQLSSAEQKKLRKAEKAARREGKKSGNSFGGEEESGKKMNAKTKIHDAKTNQVSGKDHGLNQKNFHFESNNSKTNTETKNAKIAENRGNNTHRRASVNMPEGSVRYMSKTKGLHAGTPNVNKEHGNDRREVALFGHLYGPGRRMTIDGAPKEVHPSVLALGLQMSSYTICGSNARCVAMLFAFKTV